MNYDEMLEKNLEKRIDKFVDEIFFVNFYREHFVSCRLIEKYKDRYEEDDWLSISAYQKLTGEFIVNNLDKLYIYYVFQNANIEQEVKDYIRMFV